MVVIGFSVLKNVYNNQVVVGYDFYFIIIDWIQGGFSSVFVDLDGVSIWLILEGGNVVFLV